MDITSSIPCTVAPTFVRMWEADMMNRFLLLASMVFGITGIAMPHPGSSDSLARRDATPESPFSSLDAQDLVDEDLTGDSLLLTTGDFAVSAASDLLIFPRKR